MWEIFVQFLDSYRVGDLAGLVGIIISLAGFFLTIVGVSRSKKAAEAAATAAEAARNEIKLFDSIVDFTRAIFLLEEIKKSQRSKDWIVLPDRYASVRKILIKIKSSGRHLEDEQLKIIQNAIINLSSIEKIVERIIAGGSDKSSSSRFNSLISNDIDRLVELLEYLRASEARNK